MELLWIGFFASVITLLAVSRYHLPLALLLGSLVLGCITLSPGETMRAVASALSNPSYLALSVAMALFPVLGAALQEGGMLDDLVENLAINRKAFMAVSAAVLGLLPVPGGALLSAPLVKKAAGDHPPDKSFVVNIWFRHILILIYPLSPALLIPADIAGVDVYDVIPYLVPFFLLFTAVGYVTLLRDIGGEHVALPSARWKKAALPLAIILVAPIIDFCLKRWTSLRPPDAATLVAVLIAVIAAVAIGRVDMRRFASASRRSHPEKFFAIIMCMYFFIEVFSRTELGAAIGELDVPLVVLCVGIGFFLAFIVGRTQLAAVVVFPAYLGITGAAGIGPLAFTLTYVSIFLGYLISPLHPCISVSLEFFDTTLVRAIRIMAPSVMGILGLMAVLFMLLI